MGHDMSSSKVRIIAGLLCLALSSVSPVAAVTGYSIYDGDLVAVDLETGAFAIIGDTGLNDVGFGAVVGLAAEPDGELYAVVRELLTFRLYRVDRATGASTLVGDLGDDLGVADLAFDAGGSLWMVAEDALYTVDTASAVPTLIGVPDRPLVALAARDGVLYGLADMPTVLELVTVDPGTAVTTVIGALPDLSLGGSLFLAGLAFDAGGTLWASVAFIPPILPDSLPQAFFKIPDVEAPVPELTFTRGELLIFAGLAIAPGVFDPVVEIPTLGPAGGALLAVLLLGGGLLAIRWRRAE